MTVSRSIIGISFTFLWALPLHAEGNGNYYVGQDEGGVYFQTDKHRGWQIEKAAFLLVIIPLINEAGKYVQYAIMADGFYASTTNEKINNFIMAFKQHYGENPGVIEAFAYDTAMIAFQTANNSGVYSRSDLKEELRNLRNFDGMTGVTSFRRNGDAEKKLYVLQIEGNKFVEFKSN